ncbi:ArnT family glycosyltransferase [Hymenobacter weizhouensis]|uniref:ArnT family glycosyltransferase n=1 Tax=Hymenobacter sp. YIM 151500-1 TaxID=2987689 RepID=UPI002227EF0A|nr:glycosyltransferase family 39 protein [Hymenobacter sp. YIM 151500-1]UYZ62083.1 glycosyltransferase family 39 protein [Hymenobacter sp. YIM 151500-1]
MALALGFYDYNFDFFHPRTLSLVTVDSVTGVELPLQAYLAGLLGLVVGRANITVAFRCLDLAMMVTGFYFLFRLLFESTGRFWAGLVPVAFLLTSPVFIYYSGTYTPDPFSVSLLAVATYYYWRFYYRDRQFRHLVAATLLSGLAMLVKLSSGVYFIAFSSVILMLSYFWPSLLTLRQKIAFLSLIAGIILTLLGYVLYHHYLQEAYGPGLFLAKALPIQSFREHEQIWEKMRLCWSFEYFTPAGYVLLKGGVIVLLLYAVLRWRQVPAYSPVGMLLVLCALGVLGLYILLGSQIPVHDYYIIAPLLPLLLLLVCAATWCVAAVFNRGWGRWLTTAVLMAAVAWPMYAGFRHHHARMADPYKPHSDSYVYRWLVGGEDKLRAAGVPASAFILVLGEDAPNLSLVYFNRRGIVWKPELAQLQAETVLRSMAGRRLAYLVMRRQILELLRQQNPALLNSFRLVLLSGDCAILQPLQPPTRW